MSAAVVAETRSRNGGRCERCGCRIRPGDPVVKIDTGRRGHQTSHGNGPGEWWCRHCADRHAVDPVVTD